VIDYLRLHFQHQNVAVLYIYFDYQDRQNQKSIRILQTLLKQVVSQLDIIPSELVALYEECIRRNTSPDILTLLEQFLACCQEFDSTYVLLDGFDECDDSQQEQILSLIHKFLRQCSLRIMLTSRPYLHRLQTLFESSLLMEFKAEEEDIRKYLSTRLEKIRYLSQDLKSEIIDVITRGAEGM
jgi:hypothetical protein